MKDGRRRRLPARRRRRGARRSTRLHALADFLDDRSGPAIFFRLRDLTPGDEVIVHHADGTTTSFVVDRLDQHPKGAFPTDRVYGHTEETALRLITCGGSFDRDQRSYRDNVFVFATAR